MRPPRRRLVLLAAVAAAHAASLASLTAVRWASRGEARAFAVALRLEEPPPPPEPVSPPERRAVPPREASASATALPARVERIAVRTASARSLAAERPRLAVVLVALERPSSTAPTADPGGGSGTPSPAGPGALPDAPPQLLGDPPAPRYPPRARDEGREGTVLLRLTVAADGTVTEAVVVRSSGSPDLDAAAREAASRWRLRPARRAGVPVAAEVQVPVRFRLG